MSSKTSFFRPYLFLLLISFFLVTPFLSVRADPGGGGGQTLATGNNGITLQNVIAATVTQIITPLTVLAFGISLLLFFWGVVKYMQDEKERESGRSFMMWGIIALFVSISVWGLVTFIQRSFPGLEATTPPTIWKP